MTAGNQPPGTEHEDLTALMDSLDVLYARARAEHRGLDALTLVAARDAVEMLSRVMVAVRVHRFDSQHIHDKGVYPRPRLADRMLYEAAGLPPLVTNADNQPFVKTSDDR